ncbi:MAG TPA: flagellar biosynthesis anti-sigma factor FlgM [Tepidisphaeraceae bacterium]|jgi:anti-sigma28 factor (negative regulator of flagellin synthesis)
MNVNPLHNAQSIARAYGTQSAAKPAAAAPTAPARGADRLELGTVDRLMTQLKTNDVRWDKVNLIKSQIEAGTYETEDKLDGAADKLIDELS